MASRFGESKSTTGFKIALVKLINSYPKPKNSSYLFTIFKNIQKQLEKFAKKTLVKLNK